MNAEATSRRSFRAPTKSTTIKLQINKKTTSTKLPKWYVIRIDYARENYVIKQLDELVENKILLDYKKASMLSGNIIIKYKLIFIKTILSHKHFAIITKMTYIFGFYPSNSNIIAVKDIENYQTKDKLNAVKNTAKQKINNTQEEVICGQYVVIKNGFFSGNKGKVVSIIRNLVSIEVEFYDNTLITTEVDVRDIVAT